MAYMMIEWYIFYVLVDWLMMAVSGESVGKCNPRDAQQAYSCTGS